MPCVVSSVSVQQRKFLSSFGRNRGRTLRPLQQTLIDTLLPKISVDLADPLAGISGEVALEIGFGSGEHLRAQAAYNPHITYIGCEPYLNGVARCLSALPVHEPANIRIYMDDARNLLEALPPQSIDSVFILFPDPWPKIRHQKRRLVNAQTLEMVARIHKKGGRLLIATDHVDYSVWILERLLANTDYRWTAESPEDFLTPPSDWTQTKYQRKTTEQGRAPQFFECVRL